MLSDNYNPLFPNSRYIHRIAHYQIYQLYQLYIEKLLNSKLKISLVCNIRVLLYRINLENLQDAYQPLNLQQGLQRAIISNI